MGPKFVTLQVFLFEQNFESLYYFVLLNSYQPTYIVNYYFNPLILNPYIQTQPLFVRCFKIILLLKLEEIKNVRGVPIIMFVFLGQAKPKRCMCSLWNIF